MVVANWQEIGTQLLGNDPRPLALIDSRCDLIVTNPPFLGVLKASRDRFFDQWLDEAVRATFESAINEVLSRRDASRVLRLTGGGGSVELLLELSAPGTGPDRLVLGAVLEVRSRELVAPVLGTTYEVSFSSQGPGAVRSAPRGSVEQPTNEPRACWDTMFGRASECPDCPVRKLGKATRAVGVLTSADDAFKPTLLVAEQRTPTSAAVTAVDLDDDLYTRVIAARLEFIATNARLTPRERDLLKLLLAGLATNAIATSLGITPRTAKFHQQNVLRKVGAESRFDLVRLFS